MVERERKIKRAKEREKNEGRLGERTSLPSFFPALSLALHYLNAWNRLSGSEWPSQIAFAHSFTFLLVTALHLYVFCLNVFQTLTSNHKITPPIFRATTRNFSSTSSYGISKGTFWAIHNNELTELSSWNITWCCLLSLESILGNFRSIYLTVLVRV